MLRFYFILSRDDVYALNNILQKPFPVATCSSCMPVINFHCTVISIQNIGVQFKAAVTRFDFCKGSHH